MSTELIVDFSTIEGIRTALKDIRSHRHFMIMMRGELEAYLEKLNKLEKDCIDALVMEDLYPHQSSKLYIPEHLCSKNQ